MFQIDYEKGIVNAGDVSRIVRVMRKALRGEKITIGFIGGSITQGARATTQEGCYASLTYRWFQEAFPQTEIALVNAGVGGTSSQFGVARANADLLSYHPDLCVIEFSVNDENTEHYKETYEGLVRRIFYQESLPAVLLLFNTFYDGNGSAEDVHLAVAKHYDLPAVSLRSTLLPVIEGSIELRRVVTPDDLHPNDEGHQILSDVICNYLKKIKAELEKDEAVSGLSSSDADYPQPIAPLTRNRYEDSVRYQADAAEVLLKGFEKDLRSDSYDHFGLEGTFCNGWTAAKVGDRITVEVEGTKIAVQYRKSVRRPAPIATMTVDGEPDTAMILDGNFDQDWGDCLFLQTLDPDLEPGIHQVMIEITETHEDDVVPFYLVSVIASARD